MKYNLTKILLNGGSVQQKNSEDCIGKIAKRGCRFLTYKNRLERLERVVRVARVVRFKRRKAPNITACVGPFITFFLVLT